MERTIPPSDIATVSAPNEVWASVLWILRVRLGGIPACPTDWQQQLADNLERAIEAIDSREQDE